jgi:hypothetical protein
MPLWGWLALALGGAYVWSKSSTSSGGATATPPPLPPSGQPYAPTAPTGTGTVPYDPSSYGPLSPGAPGMQAVATAPATVAPGTPSSASASGPLYGTGYHEVHTGAPIVRDGWGRTYVHR